MENKVLTWKEVLKKNGIDSKDGVLFPIHVIFPEHEFGFDGCDNVLYGYADANRKIVIAPQFSKAYNFINGLAIVEVSCGNGEHKSGYIYSDGTWALEPTFDYVSEISETGIIIVEQNGKCRRGRATIGDNQRFTFEFSDNEFDDLILDDNAGISRCIGTKGDIDFIYDAENDKILAGPYREISYYGKDHGFFNCLHIENEKRTLLNKELNPICDEELDAWEPVSGDCIVVSKGDKFAFVYLEDGKLSPWFDKNMERVYENGKIIVHIGAKCGIYSYRTGNWYVEPSK